MDGPTKISMGVADWMMAFKQNGHAEQVGDFLDFVYSEKNVLAFSREYDLLPVTNSASTAMSAATQDADLKPFLDAAARLRAATRSGKTSWARSARPSRSRSGRRSARRQPGGGAARSCRLTRREAESAE